MYYYNNLFSYTVHTILLIKKLSCFKLSWGYKRIYCFIDIKWTSKFIFFHIVLYKILIFFYIRISIILFLFFFLNFIWALREILWRKDADISQRNYFNSFASNNLYLISWCFYQACVIFDNCKFIHTIL